MSEEPRGRRSGGRSGRQALRASHAVEASAFLTRVLKPVELVSEEGLSMLESNADRILVFVPDCTRHFPREFPA